MIRSCLLEKHARCNKGFSTFINTFYLSVPFARIITVDFEILLNAKFLICATPTDNGILAKISLQGFSVPEKQIPPKSFYVYYVSSRFTYLSSISYPSTSIILTSVRNKRQTCNLNVTPCDSCLRVYCFPATFFHKCCNNRDILPLIIFHQQLFELRYFLFRNYQEAVPM